MSERFLTAEEMQQLIGLKLPSSQAGWFMRNGYEFVVDAEGQCVVAASEVQRHQGEGATANIDALDQPKLVQ